MRSSMPRSLAVSSTTRSDLRRVATSLVTIWEAERSELRELELAVSCWTSTYMLTEAVYVFFIATKE